MKMARRTKQCTDTSPLWNWNKLLTFLRPETKIQAMNPLPPTQYVNQVTNWAVQCKVWQICQSYQLEIKNKVQDHFSHYSYALAIFHSKVLKFENVRWKFCKIGHMSHFWKKLWQALQWCQLVEINSTGTANSYKDSPPIFIHKYISRVTNNDLCIGCCR